MKKRFDACVSLLSLNKEELFLHHMVIYNEKCIIYDNRKGSASWLNNVEASKHSPKPNIHQKKLMVTAWWRSHGLIYYSFTKASRSITAETYCNQLDNMMKNLAEKQPKLVNWDRSIFLHDNARPNTANRTQLKILKLDLETIDHPPYSPNLSPTDYHLFWNLDNFLQGKIFISQRTVENVLYAFISFRFPGFYAKSINKLPLKWQKCIDALGACFE